MQNDKHTSILAIADIDSITIQEARKTFMAYVREGIFRPGCFEDDIWYASDELHTYSLNFEISDQDFQQFGSYLDMDLNRFKDCLKTFVICQMGNLVFTSLQSIILGTKKMISCPVEKLEKLADEENILFANKLQDFIAILPKDGREEKLDLILDKLDIIDDIMRRAQKGGQRSLGAFESYFRFNEILHRFWKESENVDERLFYFPVWLWWNISAILPLRPREFIVTPRRCLVESDGSFFINIRRNRIKGSGKKKAYHISKDYQLTRYQITSELAREIQWYIDKTKEYGINNISTLLCTNNHYARWKRNVPYTSNYYTYVNLATCLRYFYEDIVQNRYGYTVLFDSEATVLNDAKEINYLHLGDTRHLALINAIAEGATPMVAMMLAGHDNPNMTAHYYSNISTLIECRTYRQYKKMLKGKQSYAISRTDRKIFASEFVVLGDKSRCYSTKVRQNDYTDCQKAAGPSGEIGFCLTCIFHRGEGQTFADEKEKYKNRIMNECRNLEEIVKRVRRGRGEKEEIVQALLRLRDSDYSYQRYLFETMGNNEGEL